MLKDLLYESTSRKVLAPAVNSVIFYGPKTEHSHGDSDSEVAGILSDSVKAKFTGILSDSVKC